VKPEIVNPQHQQQQRPRGIKVAVVKFATPQDHPCFSVASSCDARSHKGRPPQYEIEFFPMLQAFFVTALSPSKGKGASAYIPAYRVLYWEPLECLDERPS